MDIHCGVPGVDLGFITGIDHRIQFDAKFGGHFGDGVRVHFGVLLGVELGVDFRFDFRLDFRVDFRLDLRVDLRVGDHLFGVDCGIGQRLLGVARSHRSVKLQRLSFIHWFSVKLAKEQGPFRGTVAAFGLEN